MIQYTHLQTMLASLAYLLVKHLDWQLKYRNRKYSFGVILIESVYLELKFKQETEIYSLCEISWAATGPVTCVRSGGCY